MYVCTMLTCYCSFLEAGSDIIETNTYQASVGNFTSNLGVSEEEALSLITKAVDIAKQAVREYKEKQDSQQGTGACPVVILEHFLVNS